MRTFDNMPSSGERVSEEDYLKKAEENMVNLVREA